MRIPKQFRLSSARFVTGRSAKPAGVSSARFAALGFTMVEILLAMLILGIGLIMVATVLPVGADWNRENIEESVGAIIARNAVAIIRTKFVQSDLSGISALQVLTSAKLPVAETAYAYGASPAYPAANPATALYDWSAAIRKSPDPSGTSNRYDLYIFVMKKGSADQTFTGSPLGSAYPYVTTAATFPSLVGSQCVGATSGTVYRILAGSTATSTVTDSSFFYAPPADGSSVSPLIYIYQTTIAF